MVAFLGVTAAALAYALMVESRWGWRGLYVLGIAPLLMVAFLEKRAARNGPIQRARTRAASGGAGAHRFWPAIRACLSPFAGPVSLTSADHVRALEFDRADWRADGYFFPLFTERDHHWKAHQVSDAVILAYFMGAIGSMLSGF